MLVYSGVPEDRAHHINTLGLLGRCYCKGCSLGTLGKPLHVCLGLPGDRTTDKRQSSVGQ